MTLIKSSLFFLSLSLLCFCSSKKSVTEEAQDKFEDVSEEMLKNGFSSGTIVQSEDGSNCPFVIDIDDDNFSYMLDPINLEDQYKQDGMKIWFKFSPLRMQNRCEGANPVNVFNVKIQD